MHLRKLSHNAAVPRSSYPNLKIFSNFFCKIYKNATILNYFDLKIPNVLQLLKKKSSTKVLKYTRV